MCFSLAVDIRVVQVDLDAICDKYKMPSATFARVNPTNCSRLSAICGGAGRDIFLH